MDRQKKLNTWANLLRKTRAFFDSRDYTEVTTHPVVPCGAFESSIDTFRVESPQLSGELQSSPEISMKQILADCPIPIYRIAPCFRADPHTPVHRPQFTLLEYYRVDSSLEGLIETTQEYFEHAVGSPLVWRRHSIPALFSELGIDLSRAQTLEAFRAELKTIDGIPFDETDSWANLFFRVYVERIEPRFDTPEWHLVEDFPVEVSPLSQIRAGTLWAQRFEIYTRGIELCNGCVELRDPAELIGRWKKESRERERRGRPPHPYPEDLIKAAQQGLPPCAGTAVGLDRLLLILARLQGYPEKSLL